MPLLLVMIGGAIGSALRYGAGRATLALFGPALPWGTLFVNLAGGFAMGLLVGLMARAAGGTSESVRLFAAVGVLGGFTTVSSFSLETVLMIQRGQSALALGYVLASATGAILLLFAGLAVARMAPA
jgi:CrcB protein